VALSGANAAVDSSLGGNQTVLTPLFENEPLGNFHQISGSPTIDAGTPDPLLGSDDFDGQPRVQGCAPDIGADEFPSPPCPSPPGGGASDASGSGGPAAATDSIAPRIRALRLEPRRFRAARRGGSVSGVGRTGLLPPLRGRQRSLQSAAQGSGPPRRRALREAEIRQPRPQALPTLGAPARLLLPPGQGRPQRLPLPRPARPRGLRPGRYRLIAVPTDSAANRGRAARVGFGIVRR
jgi:hypothetical protein